MLFGGASSSSDEAKSSQPAIALFKKAEQARQTYESEVLQNCASEMALRAAERDFESANAALILAQKG